MEVNLIRAMTDSDSRQIWFWGVVKEYEQCIRFILFEVSYSNSQVN